MEQIQIIGHIGKDAQTSTSNGSSDTFFSVAVDNSYKKADGTKVSRTNWYTVWKEPSKLDQYLKKGTKVFVQGKLNMAISDYNGTKSIALSIQNPKIELVGGKNEEPTSNEPAQPQQVTPAPSFPATPNPSDEDLPF